MTNSTNPDYKRGYANGYNTASRNRWSEIKPPTPPNEQAAKLFSAAKKLRDMADYYRATLPKDDDMALDFTPLIDEIDDAFAAISEWLQEPAG